MEQPDLTRQPEMLPSRENTADVTDTAKENLQPKCDQPGEGHDSAGY